MSSLLLDKKMNRAGDELNYMGCNILREGQPLVHRHDEPSAAHALAKPPRSRKLAMLPLTHDFRDGSFASIPACPRHVRFGGNLGKSQVRSSPNNRQQQPGRRSRKRGSAQFIDARRKVSMAAKPSTVRPACSTAHFSIKARLSGPALAGSVAMSILFVGMMPRSV